jgi:hypothetical protein
MATTTNYSWSTPDDTALVKDGAAAIRSLGTSIDTTTKALNPSTTLGDIEYRSSSANTNTRLPIGTTGQVLAVVGGVPAWATTADQTPLTTKGDIFTFTTVDARLGVGANGTVLTADSAEATGLKWVAPATGGPTNSGAVITNYESTTSTSYTALSTAGPEVTLTTGTKALVVVSSFLGNRASMSFDISGASSFSAADTKAVQTNGDANPIIASGVYLMTGLTAGSNTFTAKYRSANGSSAPFQNRNIAVIDMGS